ncbi:MAG: thioredoxin domain-containing protein [Sphingobium phenoxybenzoativorans]
MHFKRVLPIGIAIALAIPAAAFAAKAIDWTNRVVLSSVGGHLMGNPAAPTKLIEYISYTCSHCAHFVAEGTGPLKSGWVKSGKVSVEIRNAVRDKYDLTAALLARCGGKDKFLGNHEALFANQSAWMTQLIAYDQQQPKPTEEQAALKEIAEKTGLITLMSKRGFTPAQLNTCLADPAAMKTVLAMTQDAWSTQKITGTPSFLINGKLVEAHDWNGLKAALPAPAK